jgi:transposase InsO family protein
MTDPRVKKRPTTELRLLILNSVNYVEGPNIQERIRRLAEQPFVDPITGISHQFTPRTISTWLYRHKVNGLTTISNKQRSDKNQYRKVQPCELAEGVKEVLPTIKPNKVGRSLKSAVYRAMLERGLFTRSQLSQTNFYRILRDHDLLNVETTTKLRQSFAMRFANELWQADTMHGPSIKDANGQYKKTFFIAFIDDASRVITHGEFFYNDNTANTIQAFRSALYKRGKPDRLYFDNGSNYKATEIAQACVRLDIMLCHAPVRDGAAKGKIERFFRGFRDRFLTIEHGFKSLQELNEKTTRWIEDKYNSKHHSGIGMPPIDRFNLDLDRIKYFRDDEYSEDVFFIEEDRKVSKTNVFSLVSQKFECPVDLRQKKIQVRYDRKRKHRFIVYYRGERMGEATLLDLHRNSNGIRKNFKPKP